MYLPGQRTTTCCHRWKVQTLSVSNTRPARFCGAQKKRLRRVLASGCPAGDSPHRPCTSARKPLAARQDRGATSSRAPGPQAGCMMHGRWDLARQASRAHCELGARVCCLAPIQQAPVLAHS